jgi:MFS family permease
LSDAAASKSETVGYLDLIQHNSNFRWLWFSQIISLLGDWFDVIASAALMASFTRSAAAVSLLLVVRMLAPFLVSPFAGVAADRFNRKTLLILTDVLRGFVVLGFLLVRRPEQAWILYVITALQTGLTGFWFPARAAILPDIVARRELGTSNTITTATWSVMLSLGAALGGAAAGQWGVYPSFVIDALTFFLSAALLTRIHYVHVAPPGAMQRSVRAALQLYLDGLRALRNHADMLFLVLIKPAVVLFNFGSMQVIQVTIAEQVYVIGDKGATGLGMLYAAVGLGTGIGPLITRRFTVDQDRALRLAIAISFGITAIGIALIAMLSSFPLTLLGTVLRGFGLGLAWVFSTQLLLYITPDKVRGRVFATEFALQTLAGALGAAVIGPIIDLPGVGIQGVMWGMAGLTLLPGALWLLWINSPRSHVQPAVESAE